MTRRPGSLLALALLAGCTLFSGTPARAQDEPLRPSAEVPAQDEWPMKPAVSAAQAAPAQSDSPRLVIYEVADLIDAQVAGHTGSSVPDDWPVNRMPGFGGLFPSREASGDGAIRGFEADGLLDLLRAFVEPAFDAERHDLRVLGAGSLVAQLDEAQHAWVERFLAAQRVADGAEGQMLLLEALVVRGRAGAFDAHGLRDFTASGDPDDLVLEAHEFGAVERALRNDDDVEIVSTPMVTVWARQRASISITNTIRFVQGYDEVVVEPGGQVVLDNIIGTLTEGVVWGSRAVPLGDGRWGLLVQLEVSEIERPLRTMEVQPVADLPPVSFTLPSMTAVSVGTTVALAPGEAAVFVMQQAQASTEVDGVVEQVDYDDVAVIVSLDVVTETELVEIAEEPAEEPAEPLER